MEGSTTAARQFLPRRGRTQMRSHKSTRVRRMNFDICPLLRRNAGEGARWSDNARYSPACGRTADPARWCWCWKSWEPFEEVAVPWRHPWRRPGRAAGPPAAPATSPSRRRQLASFSERRMRKNAWWGSAAASQSSASTVSLPGVTVRRLSLWADAVSSFSRCIDALLAAPPRPSTHESPPCWVSPFKISSECDISVAPQPGGAAVFQALRAG